ncbi:MAG: hypothetical protein HKO82_01940, partial [Acidimicrobiia bacterium]|nr:hypothetical protein [Acidimicrobiia bacterium]
MKRTLLAGLALALLATACAGETAGTDLPGTSRIDGSTTSTAPGQTTLPGQSYAGT